MQGAQKPDRNCCFRSICDNLGFLYAEIQIVYGIVWGLSLCYVAYLGNCLTRDFSTILHQFFQHSAIRLKFGAQSHDHQLAFQRSYVAPLAQSFKLIQVFPLSEQRENTNSYVLK